MSKTQYLIDQLLAGWTEQVSWARRETECSAVCNRRALGMTIGELRHYECACPARIEYVTAHISQPPLLTQLLEAKWSVPVSGGSGGGNPNKSESQMPGNLVRPDEILHKLNIAANSAYMDIEGEASVILEETLRRISVATPFLTAEQDSDAAHLLAVPIHEALVELGYRARRVRLAEARCPDCEGSLSVERDVPRLVQCEGSSANPPCGRSWGPEAWLALHGAGKDVKPRRGAHNAGKTHCPADHDYETWGRVGPDGRRRCAACDRIRKGGRIE